MLAVAGARTFALLFDSPRWARRFEKKFHSAQIRDMAFIADFGVLVVVSKDVCDDRFDTRLGRCYRRQKIHRDDLFALPVVEIARGVGGQ